MKPDYARFEGYIPGNDNPRWGQSYYYNFYDPKARVGALIRIGLQENQRETNTWFIVFKDGLPLFIRTNMNLPYTEGRPLGGIEVAGMRVEALVPLKQTRITQTATDFSADLVWNELLPMEDCIAMSNGEEGSMAKEIANVHIEGACKISGHIIHRGERIEINCTGFRDMSAGPRNWDALQHYRLSWPVFDNGLTLPCIHAFATGGHSAYMRMMHDGTQWRRVKHIEDNHVWADNRMSASSIHWRIVDELDRTYEYTATPIFRWDFPLDTFLLCEQIMEFKLADGTLGYGLFETGYRLPWKGVDE